MSKHEAMLLGTVRFDQSRCLAITTSHEVGAATICRGPGNMIISTKIHNKIHSLPSAGVHHGYILPLHAFLGGMVLANRNSSSAQHAIPGDSVLGSLLR